ncbi:hypothetical protein GLOIN_2v1882632 [Rhizophagus irregularis DAOM 181602=DAOM 197198]|uniref:F-box domain-containing protein n=2 Tax=Rhizophagus irregularis TaxID=588596 RepID=A0A2H5TZ05_RHIID|nr:hypothetical protein GLOIN_2v1882632 [Rhizophagus irregularis DAOM 181602=DAOM 197198]POG62757.1 hypothetical protein GLOIN_2v1882632 [Rhizophagus irregularis DAOM 181602=DAOM 197198]GET66541.1 hypothetical protein GLOIN_2v1882632 [Rhizophagus irregularis DAOM 181602=DAOM 197198]|eukprot:XP_025169623.1 hypothetical protein GLOIN_2v1882632 [Rhizophagus irregularis DAOM 181602=DAOM 197198]
MACSKIFSGDLPELTKEIIQYFRKDFLTLHSCILVNRLWCRLAIPLLWEDPFSKDYPKNYHFIEIYFSKLNENDKTKFNEYGIKFDLLHSNTLFNYPSFIKYLDTNKIWHSIKYWVDLLVDEYGGELENKLLNLVYRSLFKVFIENEGNLYSFEISRCYDKYLNDNIDLILQNPNLTYNIRNLRLSNDSISFQNIIPFFKFLCFNCNSISSIVFEFLTNNSSIIEHLSQIIIPQNNLKKISFELNTSTLYKPFLSLKTSNCSNTLNIIIFYYIDFKNIISILQEVFNQLNVLESIHILYCGSLNSDFVQQIIKVIKPFKLRSLFMNDILNVEPLQLLLQKFGDCLENFGFEVNSRYRDDSKDYEQEDNQRQLFKLIMKYCTKIRYLNSSIPYDNNIYPFIENNQHNINYITIEKDYLDEDTNYSSTVLQNLGQVLPSKLEYLYLGFTFRTDDLEIFLNYSQNTFIKKLLIKDKGLHINEDILSCIKKYIIEKERVKYLAISPNITNYELFSLKNEVNEFKLHNIIVQRFLDLYTDAYSLINDHLL